ncbi:hypothetical protein EVAR_66439_1 [Eumeta japonica]|uniref:Uncharacterized protein n=1 Tax=Eumeta variegata TaxID=151549 RepID=A0A4C2A1Z8_EUMVA|nr:hypothetical protein EVAR_66439_1 [Eumeta japonica]
MGTGATCYGVDGTNLSGYDVRLRLPVMQFRIMHRSGAPSARCNHDVFVPAAWVQAVKSHSSAKSGIP